MKSSLKLFCILLMSAGLVLPACEKKAEAPTTEEEAVEQQEEAAEEEAEEAEEAAEEAEEEAEEAEEEAEAAEEDAEEKAEEAEEAKEEAAEAKEDAEQAKEQEAAAAATADNKKEEAKKAPAKPKGPAFVGTMTGKVGGGGVTDGELQLIIKADYTVSGYFRGRREGTGFRVPVKGDIAKATNRITAKGKTDNSQIIVSGVLSDKAASGELKGSIFEKPFNTRYTLTK